MPSMSRRDARRASKARVEAAARTASSPDEAAEAASAPATGSRRRRLAVVLNPSKVDDLVAFRYLVRTKAREHGWTDPDWHYTTVEDPGTGMAHRAAADGAELVLVCGGDGTVREVCAALAHTGISVGIVPAGTGNLLARNLRIPLYLPAAIDVALAGQDRPVDLVEVSGDGMADSHYMVMGGMGFDAAIMEGVDEDLKRRIGWLAYVVSGLDAIQFPAMKLEISLDGGSFRTHLARTVIVGNVGSLQAGMPLMPDAEIDDGQLDVVMLHPASFPSWVPLAVRVLTKRRRSDDLIRRMQCQRIEIRAEDPAPRQLDGDSVGAGNTLSMQVVPGAVIARVPRR